MEGTSVMIIRSGYSHDAPCILEVHHAAIHETAKAFYEAPIINEWVPYPIKSESINALAERMIHGEALMLVAENPDHRIVGFGSIFPSLSELRSLYIHPHHGNKGIGGRILNQLEIIAKEMGLTELKMDSAINADNAERFYQKHGYHLECRSEHVLNTGGRMACAKMRKNLI